MPTQALLNRAAAVLRECTSRESATAVLRRHLQAHRNWSPLEQRTLVAAVGSYWRWLRWTDTDASLQVAVETALVLQERLEKHPDAIKPQALAARAVPAWVQEQLPAVPADWLRYLQRSEATLWVRPRLADAGRVAAALKDIAPAEPAAFAAQCSALGLAAPALAGLRYTGVRDLFKSKAFHEGAFEIQDLSSQIVGLACRPEAGQRWWDACAGEGGKTLHLSDLLGGTGQVWATDRSTGRLESLAHRAQRAAVHNYRASRWDGSARLPSATIFDGVLVDAPCSGVGTWTRHPDARWTTTLADVLELAETQLRLLEHAAPAVRPGGRIVYSVCTLTRAETAEVVRRFTALHPEFEPTPVFAAAEKPIASEGAAAGIEIPPGSTPSAVYLWPHILDAGGMFVAAWQRRK